MYSGADLSSLTKREREVLALIGLGLSSKEIAEKLHRSIKTVNTHRSSLGRKLHVSNRVNLARIAVRAGLVPNDPSSGDQEELQDQLSSQVERHNACLKTLYQLNYHVGSLIGMGFFRNCVRNLVEVLQLKCAYVAELSDDEERVKSLAAWSEHGPIYSIEHDLSCFQDTIRKNRGVLFLRSGAQDVFTLDVPFIDFEFDSYMAVPLIDPRGTIIGLIAIADDKSLNLIPGVELILRIFASRASAELQHMRAEQVYQDNARLLQAQYRSIPTPVYLWSIHGEDVVLEDYNDAAVASTTGQINSLMGTTARELFDGRPDILEDFSRVIASRSPLSRKMPGVLGITADKSEVILHYVFIAPDWIVVYTENVTDDERIERLIQRSEQIFHEKAAKQAVLLQKENAVLRRRLDEAERNGDLLRTGDSVLREVLER